MQLLSHNWIYYLKKEPGKSSRWQPTKKKQKSASRDIYKTNNNIKSSQSIISDN